MGRAEASDTGLDASYSCHVYRGERMRVVSGANLDDPLGAIDMLCAGDVYAFDPAARTHVLEVHDPAASETGSGRFLRRDGERTRVAADSAIGRPGQPVVLDGRLRLMTDGGGSVELLVVAIGAAAEVTHFFVPLDPLDPDQSYTLLEISDDPGEVRLAEITPVAFVRGTQITLADGRQCPVEDLEIGAQILTRDHGAQPLRWIGQRTLRATGPHAPVLIPSGALPNRQDLLLSQHQRLFIYQSGSDLLTDTPELLVRAGDLVDDKTIFLRPGGFVDYFHLVFDRHEIIYAECIPTESLLINERTLGIFPEDLAQSISADMPSLSHRQRFATEADKRMVRATGAKALHRLIRGD